MDRAAFTFFHSLRVRWSEVDMQAIVFNGHYLTYFDVGFTEYWRVTGLPDVITQASQGCELFARKCTIEYHAPARFDDVLDIAVRCVRIGRSSLEFSLAIFRGPEHLISGEMHYVYADTTLRKGVPVPQTWRDGLAAIDALPAD